jgi:hypothetical protein
MKHVWLFQLNSRNHCGLEGLYTLGSSCPVRNRALGKAYKLGFFLGVLLCLYRKSYI